MFHDLNVNVPQFGRKAVLETLHRLGYDVVAFSRTIQGQKKLLEKDLPTRETYSELKDARNVRENLRWMYTILDTFWLLLLLTMPIYFLGYMWQCLFRQTILHPDLKKRRRGITVLERVTIIIDDVSNVRFCWILLKNEENLRCPCTPLLKMFYNVLILIDSFANSSLYWALRISISLI